MQCLVYQFKNVQCILLGAGQREGHNPASKINTADLDSARGGEKKQTSALVSKGLKKGFYIK